MLREFGVKGVKIQEVVSLDEEMMAFLKYVARSPSLCSYIRTLMADHEQ